ncbi:Hypothetical predicted protein [Cloeon dipterum]|uniref:Uncharacterized protein n=1 Tax=Cloeon dipterum TaxID=197152 RepID=A0A8S1DVZ0_9INSE|nr:Hypothetical predicted protein [Cloeon dipterum]
MAMSTRCRLTEFGDDSFAWRPKISIWMKTLRTRDHAPKVQPSAPMAIAAGGSTSSKRARTDQMSTANLDADDPIDEDDSDASDSDDDDTAQLMAELNRIKKERATENARKEAEKRMEEERIRMENILSGRGGRKRQFALLFFCIWQAEFRDEAVAFWPKNFNLVENAKVLRENSSGNLLDLLSSVGCRWKRQIWPNTHRKSLRRGITSVECVFTAGSRQSDHKEAIKCGIYGCTTLFHTEQEREQHMQQDYCIMRVAWIRN